MGIIFKEAMQSHSNIDEQMHVCRDKITIWLTPKGMSFCQLDMSSPKSINQLGQIDIANQYKIVVPPRD